jgi:hypothetical protein
MPKLIVAAALLALASPAQPASAPRFDASISRVARSDLPHSYRQGCPVGPSQLRAVRVRHWGFDRRVHVGTLVVHASVAHSVVSVFRELYATRFPIRRMRPIDVYRGSDPASMAADNTSAFNCRYAFAAGPRRWSAHAYGKAIDVNPVENPYLDRGVVRPPAGRRYLDRSRVRPGMAVGGGPLVRAFQRIGWSWGGRWTASPDYQHFSSTGG